MGEFRIYILVFLASKLRVIAFPGSKTSDSWALSHIWAWSPALFYTVQPFFPMSSALADRYFWLFLGAHEEFLWVSGNFQFPRLGARNPSRISSDRPLMFFFSWNVDISFWAPEFTAGIRSETLKVLALFALSAKFNVRDYNFSAFLEPGAESGESGAEFGTSGESGVVKVVME